MQHCQYVQRFGNVLPIALLFILIKGLERCSNIYVKQLVNTPHPARVFCEIVSALLTYYHFLTPSARAWTKIFKRMLSIWIFPKPSIPSTTHSFWLGRPHARLVYRYLNGRSQKVVLDGVASQWSQVTSGVLQGRIIGSNLFVFFINDLSSALSQPVRNLLSDADDTKNMSYYVLAAICESFEQALIDVTLWSHDNNIQFYASKCKVVYNV